MKKILIGLLSLLILAGCAGEPERSLSEELEDARTSFNALETRAEEVIERNRELERRSNTLSQENEQLSARNQTLSSENERLGEENERLEQQLEQVSGALRSAVSSLDAADTLPEGTPLEGE